MQEVRGRRVAGRPGPEGACSVSRGDFPHEGHLRCETTGKRCFYSAKDAAKARKRAKRRLIQTERSVRAYLCEHCHLWHNTSMTVEQYKRSHRVAS